MRIGRAELLGEDILNPGRLEDGPDRTAGDDARAFRGRLEHDLAGAVVAENGVRNRGAGHGDGHHVLLGDLDPLLDCRRHFLGLARAETDAAFAVADHDQRGEAEVLAAFDDLGDAVDVDDLVDHPAFAALVAAITARTALTSLHRTLHDASLEFQTVFARGIRERFDVAVIEISAAVEHHALDPFVLRLLRDERADGLGRSGVGALRIGVLLTRRRGDDRVASGIVDHLSVDLLQALEDSQKRTLAAAAEFAANARP